MTYTIRVGNPILQFVLSVPIMLILMLLTRSIPSPNEYLGFLMITILYAASYYMAGRLTNGIAELSLLGPGVNFKWKKKPLITTLVDRKIPISHIRSWEYTKEWQYSYFAVASKNQNSSDLFFFRSFYWDDSKDDMFEFTKQLQYAINRYNRKLAAKVEKQQAKPTKNKPIRNSGDDFQNSFIGKASYYLYLGTVIFASHYLMTRWETLQTNQILQIISGILGCTYLAQLHLNRKRK